MIAKRYGRLPTEVLPMGTVPEEHTLSFNLNVALLGAISEYNANNNKPGPISSRAAARAAIAEARSDVYEMDQRKHG